MVRMSLARDEKGGVEKEIRVGGAATKLKLKEYLIQRYPHFFFTLCCSSKIGFHLLIECCRSI